MEPRFEITNIVKCRDYSLERRCHPHIGSRTVDIGMFRLAHSATPWTRSYTYTTDAVRQHLDLICSYIDTYKVLIRVDRGDPLTCPELREMISPPVKVAPRPKPVVEEPVVERPIEEPAPEPAVEPEELRLEDAMKVALEAEVLAEEEEEEKALLEAFASRAADVTALSVVKALPLIAESTIGEVEKAVEMEKAGKNRATMLAALNERMEKVNA